MAATRFFRATIVSFAGAFLILGFSMNSTVMVSECRCTASHQNQTQKNGHRKESMKTEFRCENKSADGTCSTCEQRAGIVRSNTAYWVIRGVL